MSRRPSGVSLGKVRRGRGGHDLNLGRRGSRGGGGGGGFLGAGGPNSGVPQTS